MLEKISQKILKSAAVQLIAANIIKLSSQFAGCFTSTQLIFTV